MLIVQNISIILMLYILLNVFSCGRYGDNIPKCAEPQLNRLIGIWVHKSETSDTIIELLISETSAAINFMCCWDEVQPLSKRALALSIEYDNCSLSEDSLFFMRRTMPVCSDTAKISCLYNDVLSIKFISLPCNIGVWNFIVNSEKEYRRQ